MIEKGWNIKGYDLKDEVEKKQAEAKIESIQRMWNRERARVNKTTETLQVKSNIGDYFFDVLLYSEDDMLFIKEKSVFKK